MIEAYPLSWPAGWPRMNANRRERAQFNKRERQHSSVSGISWTRKRELTVADGIGRVLAELERFGIDRQDVIISTNVRTRLDGLPRSGEREPDDPGAAVYWRERSGKTSVMAIDRYDRLADNLGAIAATLDAMRAIERHGGAQVLERAFTGFAALPAPNQKRAWWEVLGVDQDETDAGKIKDAYRRLATQAHPDRPGGSHERMAELNSALSEASNTAVIRD